MQSYQLLQPSPADQTNVLLQQMSNQIASFRVSFPLINSTQPAYGNPPPFAAHTYVIWLNTLWFVSLVFSLASATIGIIVKQWLKEYSSGLYGNSREIGRRRQYRLDSLEKWHVAEIVAVIPLLLLIALVLFLAGLVILLHSLHGTVASITSTFIGILLLFVMATTVLPSLKQSCCYYSAQAYLFFKFYNGLALALSSVFSRLRSMVQWSKDAARRLRHLGTLMRNITPSQDHRHRMASILRRSCSVSEYLLWWKKLVKAVHRLISLIGNHKYWTATRPTGKGAEQAAYSSQRGELNVSTMLTAYTATLNTTSMYDAIACLTGESYSWKLWYKYVSALKDVVLLDGKPDQCPPNILGSFCMLLLSAESQCFRMPCYDDYTAEWDCLVSLTNEYDTLEEAASFHEAPVQLDAWRSAHRHHNLHRADDAWHRRVFWGNIHSAKSYQIGQFPMAILLFHSPR